MTSNHLRGSVSALGLIAALTFGAASAGATEGYFQTGYGTIQKAQGGAGVANPEDAMTLSVNPAGLVHVGNQFNMAFTLCSPRRDVTVGTPGLLPMGKTESHMNHFLMPNMAYSRQIDAQSAWGVAVFGNGGMNTSYPAVANPTCALMGGGSGLFCGGPAGVNLEQMFVTVGYARKMGDLSIGVAPIIAMQKFRAAGLGAFGMMGFSTDPTKLTNNGDDYSFGAGVRVGLQYNLQPGLRLGLTGQTPIWSTKLDKYAGLFADGGSFDIPGSVSAGLAWDVTKDLTLMADWRHIFYSGVPAIANSSLNPALFGAKGGPGFGWSDVDAFSLAAAYKATADLTLRLGYSHNTNPVHSRDVLLNILAPGVVTDRFSAGASYKVTPSSGIDLAFGYVPRSNVSGATPVLVTPLGAMPSQNVRLSMEQWEASVGYTYKF